MKIVRGWVLTGLVVIGATASVRAQLAVQIHLAKDTFLLYETVPITVTIRNFAGRPIQLTDMAGEPWLRLVVTDENGSVIPAVRQVAETAPAVIAGGLTLKRTVDLLPLYALRQRGNYRAQATVRGAGTTAASGQAKFTIINGRELWSQLVGLPPEVGKREEYRTYSLVSRRDEREDSLYVLVRDEPNELVYGLVGVGAYLLTGDPVARVDRAGHLHLLFQNGPRSFGYVRIDPAAKVLERAAYADFLSRPQLIVTDGVVSVLGGEQTYPRSAQVATDEKPVPPRPTPKPKRKWWWPFGPRQTRPAGS